MWTPAQESLSHQSWLEPIKEFEWLLGHFPKLKATSTVSFYNYRYSLIKWNAFYDWNHFILLVDNSNSAQNSFNMCLILHSWMDFCRNWKWHEHSCKNLYWQWTNMGQSFSPARCSFPEQYWSILHRMQKLNWWYCWLHILQCYIWRYFLYGILLKVILVLRYCNDNLVHWHSHYHCHNWALLSFYIALTQEIHQKTVGLLFNLQTTWTDEAVEPEKD